ncbi:MAG: hypothetical protein JWN08_2941 [Frankiales bacterium]|nr:hypothetical protein [Frankiales bacterium]
MTAVLLAVDESKVSAGPLGLLVVILMVVATIFLIKNMNQRLKRLPRDFPEPRRQDPSTTKPPQDRTPDDGTP